MSDHDSDNPYAEEREAADRNRRPETPVDAPMVYEDLTPIEVPVQIGRDHYIMKEATDAAMSQYKSYFTRSARFEDGKPVGLGEIGEADTLLLSLCLFKTDPADRTRIELDRAKRPVTESLGIIKRWPHHVVKDLFARLSKISHLAEEEETVETLLLKRSRIDKRLRELGHGDTPPKEPAGSTTGGSD